ncbi:MAG: T9SS type A sorting domain-containing protein [Bacteroidales bacterium]|nr:T9SS type A sorting domain-containing protein [Bacteroidales bacterium]
MKTRLLALLLLLPFLSIGQQYKLITATESNLTIDIQVPDFQTQSVTTPQGEAFVVKAHKAMNYAEAGEPDLPMFVIPTIVGDQALMQVNVITAEYVDYQDMEIAPSKGDFPRSINPEDVPYTYGEAYQRDAFFPLQLAKLDEPYIHRDVRGQNIMVTPYQYNPVTKTLRIYTHLVLSMDNIGKDDRNIIENRSRSFTLDPEFKTMYEHRYINYKESMAKYTPIEENGELLIICHDAFMTAMEPFVAWKKQIGRPTTIVGTSITGNTDPAIKSYIQTFYAAHPDLTDILLVGDVAQIPGVYISAGSGYSGYSGYGDVQYGQLAGNDYYNEVIVGRFCCETEAQVTNHVNKVLNYERDLDATATWLSVGQGVSKRENAAGHNGEDDYQHIDNIRNDLLNYGYTEVHRDYQSVTGVTASAAAISQHINAGVSIINYCNHGNITLWGVFSYSNSHVNALTNDYKLPYIISVACLNGKYDNNGDCFAEAWMRATNNSNGNPTGAIGGMFSYIEQPWQPPMYGQDEMVDILTEQQANNIKHTMGGVSINGNMKVLDLGANSNANKGTYNTWILFGDPTLTLRNASPADMNVSHNAIMDAGATSFTVNAPDGEGALATLTKDGEIMGSSPVTNGTATITFTAPGTAGEATLTVFGYNKLTYIGTVNITTGGITYPSAPTNVTAAVNNQSVTLNWDAVTPADSYKVYRNNRLLAQGITATTYTDSDLQPGTYSYEVTTMYNGLESPKSTAASATIVAILSVTVTASNPIYVPNPVPGGWTGITLTANASGGSGNYTYSWTPANAVNNPTAQSTTASPLETTTYTCTVTSNGQSVSGSVTVIVVNPPTEVNTDFVGDNEVRISWNAADYADGYNVYREDELIAESIPTLYYTDLFQGAGSVHYQVRSVYQGHVSQPEITSIYFCVAPENVQAEYIWNDGDFFNRISWTKNQAVDYEVTHFNIYQNDSDGMELIGTVESEDYVYEYSFDDLEATAIGVYFYTVSAVYTLDCEIKSDPVNCTVTSVGESAAKPELFPNPTAGKVTVKAEGMERIVVVNSLGQTLYQANTEAPEMALDLAPFGKGMYFIMLQTSQGVTTQRIVVE